MHQKLGVIRTLLDRCKNIVTEVEDREVEEEHILKALKNCGYPDWTYKQVKGKILSKDKDKVETKKGKDSKKKRKQVVLPYVKGITETISRVYSKHGIATSCRPHCTLRKLLVHPKDRVEDLDKSDVVYKVQCKNCKNSYIGETGRRLEIRIGEHKKEAMPFEIRQQTRATKIKAAREQQKSAITDHVISSGHLIDWDNVKVLDRESDRTLRWIKEAIWIRKSTPVMNRDEGGYQLSHIYDSLITVATSSGGHS